MHTSGLGDYLLYRKKNIVGVTVIYLTVGMIDRYEYKHWKSAMAILYIDHED
jgi:hypothetical protein